MNSGATTFFDFRHAFVFLCTSLIVDLAHANEAVIDLAYPPSVELVYSLKSSQKGIPLRGEAKINWQLNQDSKGNKTYRILSETTVPLFGKILVNSSVGSVNQFGLAPQQFLEKRFRKAQAGTNFDQVNKLIQFSSAELSYPIKGGEQDRLSATWQLVALVRAHPETLQVGHEWNMFVAGLKDAEPWTFKLIGFSKILTALGEQEVVHITKAPPPDAKGQQVDIWLASGLAYYPVRISFNDANGDQVDQRIVTLKN